MELVRLDRDWTAIARESRENPSVTAGPDNLAYVIYKTGSTASPEGVQIPHRAVVNFVAAMKNTLGITERETLLAVTPISCETLLQ